MSHLLSHAPALANHLWQSTAFAAAVWLVTLVLRGNRAKVRFGLWLAASVKFMLPFSLLMGLGGMLPKPRHIVAEPQMPVYLVMDETVQPFSGAPAHVTLPAAAPTPPVRSLRRDLPGLLAAIWLCGAITALVVWCRRLCQVYATLRKSVPTGDAREGEILRRLESQAKARTRIRVARSPELMEPGIFGIFRPVLIWPEKLTEELDDEHIEAILAHERMHVQRHDNLTAAMHMAVEAVFWFHPLVWWMEKRLVEERERACDEAVVEMGSKPGIYAESLLKTCRYCAQAPLTCVSGITGADLGSRVRSIMTLRLTELSRGKKAMLAALALAAVAGPLAFGLVHAAYSRDGAAGGPPIVGTWQGILHNPNSLRDVRLEIMITRTGGGGLQVVSYSIEPGATATKRPATFQNGVLKYSIEYLDGSYEGKISADGNTIAGTWTQGPTAPLPLMFKRVAPDKAWPLPVPRKAMAAGADPSFHLAIIVPNDTGATQQQSLVFTGSKFVTQASSIEDLIAFAYDVQAKQIVAGPAWVGAERYDIDALPSLQGIPDSRELQAMVRKLLAGRFKLAFHYEKRTMSAYVLRVAPGGQKLTLDDSNAPLPGIFIWPGAGGLMLGVRNAAIPAFTSFLEQTVLNRPVVDRTGLTGHYDFSCTFTPDGSLFGGHPPPTDASKKFPAAPGFFDAMRQQLNLELSAETAPVQVIVIDHVERPQPN